MGTCASGASVRGGVSPTKQIEIGGDLWRTLMGGSVNWWDYLVSFFQPTYVEASALCTANPVDPGDPTLADWVNAIGRDPFTLLTINKWWEDKLSYLAFTQNCVCNSPPAFTCTTLLNHPWAGGSTSSDVQNYRWGVEFVPSVDMWCYGGYLEIATVGSGTVQHGIAESGGFALLHLETIAPTIGDNRYFFATPQKLYGGHTYKYYYQFANAGWHIHYDTFNTTPTTIAGVSYLKHVYQSDLTSPFIDFNPGTTSPDPLFCPSPGTPPFPVGPVQPSDLTLPVPPTCTTTADLCTQINALMERVIWLQRNLSILQNRAAPYGFTAGSGSTGLTGSGTLAALGAVGVIVDLTTVPATWGSTAETPRHLIPSIGSIQATDGTNFTANQQIHYERQIIMLDADWCTDIRYNLRAGAVATLTPLFPLA